MKEKEIGLRIAAKREARGISQGALAKSVGLSRPYITQIENGTKKASPETLLKLMSALGMDYKEFMSEDTKTTMSREEKAILEGTMPLIVKLNEYLTFEQFNEILILFSQTNEAAAAMQSHLKQEPMPSGPDGWLDLSKEDRRLVQRVVNRLLRRKE